MLVSGCAGRAANPVSGYVPGDEKRSCEALKTEYYDNEAQIKKLQQEQGSKTWWNVGCFVTGFLVIVPWFLMDLKDSQKIEIDALQKRNVNLKILAVDNKCDFLSLSEPTAAVPTETPVN
jgi:hypothetical protein